VQRHRISSQCASGAGQFLENVGRSLGVSLADTDTMARQSTDPKSCSPVCAVLAETDVINQFSHGASVPDLLQGVHRFIASLCTRLLNSTGASGVALVTGGTARSHSMLGAIREAAADLEAGLDIRVHADSLFAGAIGAALWGAYRARRYAHQPAALARMSAVPQPPPLPATPATLPTELARWKP
jgi:benzoyl-CoA reductase subunit D